MSISMNTAAAGAYLRVLREKNRLDQDDLAALVREKIGSKTNYVQISRLEAGKVTEYPILMAVMEIVKGSADEFKALLFDPSKTVTDGEIAALHYWQARSLRVAAQIDAETASDDVDATIEGLEEFRRNRRDSSSS